MIQTKTSEWIDSECTSVWNHKSSEKARDFDNMLWISKESFETAVKELLEQIDIIWNAHGEGRIVTGIKLTEIKQLIKTKFEVK